MRKFIIIFALILLISCENNFDDINYSVTNNSKKTITYIFNNDTYTLLPEESKNYTINSGDGTFKPLNLEFEGSKYSIKLDTLNKGRGGIFYTFNKVDAFYLHVVNTLPIEVTIKADDFIYNEGETTLTISENSFNNTAIIYTKKPIFSLVSEPYPVIFDLEFKDDTLYVIIR